MAQPFRTETTDPSAPPPQGNRNRTPDFRRHSSLIDSSTRFPPSTRKNHPHNRIPRKVPLQRDFRDIAPALKPRTSMTRKHTTDARFPAVWCLQALSAGHHLVRQAVWTTVKFYVHERTRSSIPVATDHPRPINFAKSFLISFFLRVLSCHFVVFFPYPIRLTSRLVPDIDFLRRRLCTIRVAVWRTMKFMSTNGHEVSTMVATDIPHPISLAKSFRISFFSSCLFVPFRGPLFVPPSTDKPAGS